MSGDTEVAGVVPSVREGRFDYRLTDEVAYLAPALRPETSGLHCAFTLRYAGRSGQRFNLGFDRGTRLEVLTNRRRLLHAMGMEQATLCSIH